MGIRIDEAGVKALGSAGATGSKRTSIPPASVDPLDVPLPLSARTARNSPRPATFAATAADGAMAQPPDEDVVSVISAIDPAMVPLPPTSRTAAQTARTERGAAVSEELVSAEGAASEPQEQQSTNSEDAEADSTTASTDVAAELSIEQRPQPADDCLVLQQAPQNKSDDILPAAEQTEANSAGESDAQSQVNNKGTMQQEAETSEHLAQVQSE